MSDESTQRTGQGERTGTRVPPHVVDLEGQVLGAALVSAPARDLAVDRLTPEAFHDLVHGNIFHTIQTLVDKGRPADPPAVAAELERTGLLEIVGGSGTLVSLQANCYTRDPASVDGWIDRILEAWSRRRLAQSASEITEIAYSGVEADHALEQAEKLVTEIAAPGADRAVGISELLAAQVERVERIRTGSVEAGSSTGLKAVDELIGGLVAQRMYVIAARPGLGKTSLAHGIGIHTAESTGRPVLIASLEMRHDEVIDRFLAGTARIDHKRLTEAELEPDEEARYAETVDRLGALPIEVIDDVTMTIPTIRAAARRLRSRHGDLGAVIIDYLSLLSAHGRASNRQEEVALISRGVKVMARQLDCPVIVLAQLNRKVEDRTDKRPVLSDLRESGQVEQDADVALMIYRDDHYNPLSEYRGIAEIIVAKNRHGRTGTAMTAWAGASMTFFDLPEHVANSITAPNASSSTGNHGGAPVPAGPPPSSDVDEF